VPESWSTDLASLAYAAYFPLVLLAVAAAPLVAPTVGLPLLAATRYALVAGVVAYGVGLAALLR
jgi:hypothetical protein